MADVKWIKIKTDIFDNEKFRIIDTMPMADTIEVIWFKLLVFAGRSNNNGIFMFNDRIAYTDEMLAKIFGRDLDTVRLALQTFIKLDMVEEIDGVYSIKNWDKHQPQLEQLKDEDEKTEKKRKYDRERMRKIRAERKSLSENALETAENKEVVEKSFGSRNDSRTESYDTTSYSISNSNNTTVLNNIVNRDNVNTENKIIDKRGNSNTKNNNESIIYILNILNNRAGTKYRATTKSTQTMINARLKEGFTVEDFETVIEKKCNEWLGTEHEKFLRPETLFCAKHFESYLNQNIVESKPKSNGLGEQKYDWEKIEKEFLND